MEQGKDEKMNKKEQILPARSALLWLLQEVLWG